MNADIRSESVLLGRRSLLTAAAGLVCSPVLRGNALSTDAAAGEPVSAAERAAAQVQHQAQDEAHWEAVARFFDRTDGVVNLEHGYWGRMARPVLEHYTQALERVNRDGAWYARRLYGADYQEARARVAALLGADPEEVALTRNATEAIHNLIRQFRWLGRGDAVLVADVDYPSFRRLLEGLGAERGVEVIRLALPPRATQDELADLYRSALARHRHLRLALVTHVSNQHGLVLPVAAIADAARAQGVYILCDAAQSIGLLDYRVVDLNCDWVGFNLHKWIGSPLGLGALYMRSGTLDAVAPYPGEHDGDEPSVQRRIHTGTWDFAAAISIPAALDFHLQIGGAQKEARLRYLRSLWTTPAQDLSGIEVLGGADEASWSGMGSFRLAHATTAEDARALQQRLLKEFNVFTVPRYGLASGACVRITPQVFTRASDVAVLTAALKELAA
ncbi:MAG: aminotransferase class V-fold PLP-dependent enzyme [Pseudomonadota bacterium]